MYVSCFRFMHMKSKFEMHVSRDITTNSLKFLSPFILFVWCTSAHFSFHFTWNHKFKKKRTNFNWFFRYSICEYCVYPFCLSYKEIKLVVDVMLISNNLKQELLLCYIRLVEKTTKMLFKIQLALNVSTFFRSCFQIHTIHISN